MFQLVLIGVIQLCKFTPLGFETGCSDAVNTYGLLCKFTPLGFETKHLLLDYIKPKV